ncbi:photosystem reaction center subunit H [Bordetella genomosp. 9]|uniref:Photosystem reaction center subunit H n=3 Tax=Alcaligenaceae TaxID=506 RepID=A0A261RQC5_9BORD|nr:photosystem reaction center subunit H [Bordetella bronchialis]OZI26872.1 photosystem reaction center subunit H [Bordetella genomosp. 9]
MMQRTAISSIFAASRYTLAIVLVAVVPSGTILAQGAPQSITEKRVDVVQLATGYRASKLIGSDVLSGEKDKIGTVDDIIVSPANQEPYAILSVGGFLGVGNRLVAVPFKELHVDDKRLRMDGASKDTLRALPEFRYVKD